ncbi:hypothetical protein AgCh_020818 [Apium graveolens]
MMMIKGMMIKGMIMVKMMAALDTGEEVIEGVKKIDDTMIDVINIVMSSKWMNTESGAVQRVLKISRSEPSGLDIIEDSTTYSKVDCDELLQRIHHGNLSTGGLEFVTVCYGIVGFVKFLGPYYMLLITERREIGVICGHSIYAITGSKLISVPSSTVQSAMAYSKNENRLIISFAGVGPDETNVNMSSINSHNVIRGQETIRIALDLIKSLLCSVCVDDVDIRSSSALSKGFFFSYSYHVMNSVERNMSDHEAGQTLYENMYVWNKSMTRGIRNQLKNTHSLDSCTGVWVL